MKKFVNFRLIVFLASSLCIGISSVYFFVCKMIFWLISSTCLFLGLILLYVFIRKEERKKRIIMAVAFLIAFIVGGTSFGVVVMKYSGADMGNHYYSIVGKIESTAKTDYGSYLVLSDVYVEGNVNKNLDYKVAAYVNDGVDYDVGDLIFFEATLKDKSLFYDGKFSAYDVQRKIKYFVNVNREDVFYAGTSRSVFENINVFIREALKKGLNEAQFSLSYAMLTGNDEYIAPETLSSYRQAGVAHVFAVSGLHIGFVATAIAFVLKKLKATRVVTAIITVPMLFFYSGICGFSSSSIRAAVMATVLLVASIDGQKYDKYTSIATATLVVLLISPIELFCAGFQLSFGIVFGMFVLTPPISKLLRFLPRKLSNSVAAVLAAQISGLPISLMIFGEFSAISVIANLILIPIVGAVFILLWIALFVGATLNVYSVALFLPNCALWLINALITAFDYNGLMMGGFIIGGFTIFYYLSLIVIGGMINLRGLFRTTIAICCTIICVVGSVFLSVSKYNKHVVYVSGSERLCVAVVEHRDNSVLIVSQFNSNCSLSRLSRIVSKLNEKDFDLVVFTSGNTNGMQKFLSKLNAICPFKQVRYFGQRKEIEEIAIFKSFPNVQAYCLSEQKTISCGEIKIELILDGYLAQIRMGDKKVGILSSFDGAKVDYKSMPNGYDFLVARSMVESVYALSNTKKFLSFLINSSFNDAERQGNVEYLI